MYVHYALGQMSTVLRVSRRSLLEGKSSARRNADSAINSGGDVPNDGATKSSAGGSGDGVLAAGSPLARRSLDGFDSPALRGPLR